MKCHLSKQRQLTSVDDLPFGPEETLLREDHFEVFLSRCERCGQLYAGCWLEIVESANPEWTYWVPVNDAEAADLRLRPGSITRLIRGKRHITSHPNGTVYWTDLSEIGKWVRSWRDPTPEETWAAEESLVGKEERDKMGGGEIGRLFSNEQKKSKN